MEVPIRNLNLDIIKQYFGPQLHIYIYTLELQGRGADPYKNEL